MTGTSPAVQAAQASKEVGEPVETPNWMVAATNPLAAEAGANVLPAGCSAVDVMVAVQTVLDLVEPQFSGIGGGAFLVWYDAATGEMTTLDGRETAPISATPTLFQTEDGERMGFSMPWSAVGTFGTPALMEEAHRRWRQQPWPSLLAPSIDRADNGFAVSPRLAGLVERDAERLSRFVPTADYFLLGGTPLQVGATLTNPDYTDTLRAMAAQGTDVIYTGAIAANIVQTIRNAEGIPASSISRSTRSKNAIQFAPVTAPTRSAAWAPTAPRPGVLSTMPCASPSPIAAATWPTEIMCRCRQPAWWRLTILVDRAWPLV